MRRVLLGIALGGALLGAAPHRETPELSVLAGALDLAGLSAAELTLPRAAEASYDLPLSYPVIDAALGRPLALPAWGRRLGEELDSAQDPSEIFAALRPISPAGRAGTAELPPSAAEGSPPRSGSSALPSPVDALISDRGQVQTQHLPPELVRALLRLATLLQRLHETSPDPQIDLTRPSQRSVEDFFVDPITGSYRWLTHPVGVQRRFVNASAGVDYGAMEDGAAELLSAAMEEARLLRKVVRKLPKEGEPLLRLETSLGAIIVGTRGSDHYAEDALLVLDPGGDDRWSNNAGANSGIAGRAALALDLGGDDSYRAEHANSQGDGTRGVGVLVDLGGGVDDYLCTTHCQGSGFLGVGVLWDDGGDDGFSAEAFAQGAGTLGIGLLVDGGGDDRLFVGARGQGFGGTGGLGAKLDLGGNDQVRLGIAGESPFGPHGGIGQGAGAGTRPFPWNDDVTLHGGVGLHYDRSGDDRYYSRAFGQGAGWVLGLGILLDQRGNDVYVGEQGSQGAASHLAAGLLIDGGGNDTYRGNRDVQGSARDRAVGILWDRGKGKDTYVLGPTGGSPPGSGRGGQGSARQARALAILADMGGDDRYEARREAQADVLPTEAPRWAPTALLLDLGGKDRYESRVPRRGVSPADGATWLHHDRGIGVDTEADDIGWDTAALEPEGGFGPFAIRRPLSRVVVPPIPPPGGPWTEASALYDQLLDGATPSDALTRAEALLEANPSPSTRRLLGKILLALEDRRGLDLLIDSLSWRSASNPRPDELSGLRLRLTILTGQDLEADLETWRAWWGRNRDSWKPAERLTAMIALDRAERASSLANPAAVLDQCIDATDALPGEAAVAYRAAQLTGNWAWSLGHPESGHRDPELATALARRAISWAPDQPDYFVSLARALQQSGEPELARRAVAGALSLDPDHRSARALETELDILRGAP